MPVVGGLAIFATDPIVPTARHDPVATVRGPSASKRSREQEDQQDDEKQTAEADPADAIPPAAIAEAPREDQHDEEISRMVRTSSFFP